MLFKLLSTLFAYFLQSWLLWDTSGKSYNVCWLHDTSWTVSSWTATLTLTVTLTLFLT